MTILDPKVPITCLVGKQVSEETERLPTVLPATEIPGHSAVTVSVYNYEAIPSATLVVAAATASGAPTHHRGSH